MFHLCLGMLGAFTEEDQKNSLIQPHHTYVLTLGLLAPSSFCQLITSIFSCLILAGWAELCQFLSEACELQLSRALEVVQSGE